MSSTPHHNHAPSTTTRSRRPFGATISALALVAIGLLLSACGGSSSHPTTTPTTSTPVQQAVQVTPEGSGVTSGRAASGSGASHKTTAAKGHKQLLTESATTTQSGRAKHTVTTKPVPVAVPKGPNPCVLITTAEAESIVGAPIVGITEAPLGPTCILKVKGQRQTVTLAVESSAVANQVHQMRKLQQLTVAGHAAYCGELGRPMLDVQLSGGKILNVTAPCALAQALAEKAVPRIAA